ncbi:MULTISPECIES: LysE/ArgO family amino acid transporter [Pasteurellaceae]|uniref:LysE/ArgO family amino acid transporter n=1 Tax=Pasteurellaceae TaxID=712 RepID=UPI00356582A2
MEHFIQGFLICAGLIVTIGAQNAFILKQGLLRQHVFLVCGLCFLCDCLLFSIGVFGLGTFIRRLPAATIGLAAIGALFLTLYGARAFLSAYRGNTALVVAQGGNTQSLWKTLWFTLAITLLNPHVYLDSIVIIGGIAGTLAEAAKIGFLLGAISASGLWFFGVGYGSKLLIPFFRRPITWRLLDAITGIIMWGIAFGLIRYGIETYQGV